MAQNSQDSAARNPADHLKKYRWQKGQGSPNPGGRPKLLPLTNRYRDRLEEKLPEKFRRWVVQRIPPLAEILFEGSTYGDLVVITMILQAAKGKTEAAKEIREAVEGKALVRLRHEVPGSGPIQDESVGVEEIKKRIIEIQDRILARKK